MECSDNIKEVYKQAREKGMSYSDAISFTTELENALRRNMEQLENLKRRGSDQEEIRRVKACIEEREELLQRVKFETHGLSDPL